MADGLCRSRPASRGWDGSKAYTPHLVPRARRKGGLPGSRTERLSSPSHHSILNANIAPSPANLSGDISFHKDVGQLTFHSKTWPFHPLPEHATQKLSMLQRRGSNSAGKLGFLFRTRTSSPYERTETQKLQPGQPVTPHACIMDMPGCVEVGLSKTLSPARRPDGKIPSSDRSKDVRTDASSQMPHCRLQGFYSARTSRSQVPIFHPVCVSQ